MLRTVLDGRIHRAVVPRAGARYLPLSYAQRRLWLLDKATGPTTAYTIPFTSELHGDVNVPALRTAVADVMQRHESLRTVFGEHEGEPYQTVLPLGEIPFEAVPAGPESVREALARPFDLARDYPIRVALISDSRRDHVLVVVVHRIAADALSAGPLFADLATAYAARRALRAPEFEPLPMQYTDYALRQRAAEFENRAAYLRERLAGLPDRLDIQADRPGPAQPGTRAGSVRRDVPTDLGIAVHDLAKRTATTSFTVLRTAVAVLLSKLGAGQDIPLGMPVPGRGHALEQLVGLFADTVVLRTDLTGDPSVEQLLGRVRDADLAVCAYQDVPFDYLADQRSRAGSPMVQVMVEERQWQVRAPRLAGLRTGPFAAVPDAAGFDLWFVFEQPPGAGEHTVSVNYAPDLFDRSTVDAMVTRLLSVLEQMTGAGPVRLSGIDVQLPAGVAAPQLS